MAQALSSRQRTPAQRVRWALLMRLSTDIQAAKAAKVATTDELSRIRLDKIEAHLVEAQKLAVKVVQRQGGIDD
jgi:hypothetical protein